MRGLPWHSPKAFEPAHIAGRGLRFIIPIALLAFPPSVGGKPTYRLSWDGCDYRDQRSWEGPQLYRAIFSVTGLDSAIGGYWFTIAVHSHSVTPFCGTLPFPDAWRFDDEGCQSSRLQQLSSAADPACPSLVGDNESPVYHAGFDSAFAYLTIDVLNSFDPVMTTPGAHYTLTQLLFDMTSAVPGAIEPGSTCGGADAPICFSVNRAVVIYPFLASESPNLVPSTIGWDFDPEWCYYCPQTESATWGRVKSLYR